MNTKAPERIWADPESHWYTDNQDFENDEYNEYVRADLATPYPRAAFGGEATRSQVRVRPLEWKPWEMGDAQADSAFGTYHVWDGFYRRPFGVGGIAASDPKAAAQADYSTRIIAALIPDTEGGA